MSERHYAYGELVTRLRWEPAIPLGVQLRSGSLVTELLHAKIDSGASHCGFDRAFAEDLGLDLDDEEPEEIGAAGSKMWGWQREIEIVVPSWTIERTPVVLANTVYFLRGCRRGLALLGLIGFFNRLTLRIDDANQQLWWRRP